jgi:hypothetical protein
MAAAAGASVKASLAFGFPMAPFMWPSYTGTKRPGSDVRNSRSSTSSKKKYEAMMKPRAKQLFVCVDNDGYPASLEKRKIYVALRDGEAEEHGLLRVIDESGDDYLYPRTLFRLIDLPETVRRAVLAAA